MMRHRISWLPVVVLLLLTCTGAWAWYPHGEKYEKWQQDRPLTFGAWHNCTAADNQVAGRVADRIARFKAAGLNDFLWIKPNHKPWFRAATEAGMSWRTSMRGSRKTVREVIQSTPGCAALMTAYGPYDTDDELEDLSEWASWSRENFAELLSYAIIVDRGFDFDYDRYIKNCAPDILAVEKFSIGSDGVAERGCFTWLAKAAEAARRNRLPLWVDVQSFDTIVAKPRMPSFGGSRLDASAMRFQVFLALAHGASGIHFFMYYGHELSMVIDLGTPDPGSPGSGLPTKYENTVLTRPWFAVQDMAPEVQMLAKALLNLRPIGPVAYAGSAAEGLQVFDGDGRLRAASVVDDEPGPLAVSLFDDQAGEQYFMVVNLAHGPQMSKLDGARIVRLTFAEDVEAVERLSRHTGLVERLVTRSAKDGSRTIEFHLEAGTGDLFKWSNGNPWSLRPENGDKSH